MTNKQERFCLEYLKDSNATQAAIRAGYSARTAQEQSSRLLSKAMIQARLAELQCKVATKLELSAEWVLARLKENLTRAMQAEPVLDAKGKPTGEWRYEGAVANKALELLGKHLGMWVERVEHTGKDGGPIEQRLTALSDDDLATIAAGAGERQQPATGRSPGAAATSPGQTVH